MILTIPSALNGYPELQQAVIQLAGQAVDAFDDEIITYEEAKSFLFKVAPILIEITRSYKTLSGEQKKGLVDAALAYIVKAIEPRVAGTIFTMASAALPWYARAAVWLLSFLINSNVFDALANEIPRISQSAYDGLLQVWSKLGVPRK